MNEKINPRPEDPKKEKKKLNLPPEWTVLPGEEEKPDEKKEEDKPKKEAVAL